MNETIDTEGIAKILGCSREYATDRLVKKPDFPAPVVNRSRRMRRWAKDAVERWAAGSQSLEAISSEEAR